MSTVMSGSLSRRDFLRNSLAIAASSTVLGTLGSMGEAFAAADTTGYKALVCVYLDGGNNGFNTVVPTSTSAYNTYARSRSNLALPRNSLLPLNGSADDGNRYGLNAACPELQALFNQGRLAVLANVGTLVQPTTLADITAGRAVLPLQLFSHVDQRTAWWTSVPDQPERSGWAGRIADLYDQQGHRSRLAMNLNIGGVNYWQEGRRIMPYVLGPNGAPDLYAARSDYRGGRRRQATLDLLQQARDGSSLMVAEVAGILQNSLAKVNVVNQALSAAGDISTEFPSYPGDQYLGAQLRAVARCIKAHNQIGDSRQMYFVRFGGFDTHNDELAGQADRLRILSRNLDAFWRALGEIGEQDRVTLFTASDFGRGLGSNGDGSDHAWANHHFILGGAVNGGRYYGRMPSLEIGGADDIGAGRLIPTTATDQYAATLSRWFGVADSDLGGLFPNLHNFSTRNLGFLS